MTKLNFLFVTSLVLMFAAACSNTSESDNVCIVQGNMEGLDGEGWIYMADNWNESAVIDSTRYKEGAEPAFV